MEQVLLQEEQREQARRVVQPEQEAVHTAEVFQEVAVADYLAT